MAALLVPGGRFFVHLRHGPVPDGRRMFAVSAVETALHSLARLVLAPLLRLIYRRVIRGRGNVPRRGPVILAGNHLSFIDSIVIALLAPRPVHFLAKDEYFTGTGVEGALTRLFFTAFGGLAELAQLAIVRPPAHGGRERTGQSRTANMFVTIRL
ncbi:lysophospholipid acyltransferase family protein [Streptomyces sp. NBC_01431]|uniref:lysophospholipid acyltransferase family protein n=1 Tax=Streptomyces sp. NBC_01431 TaxID=2903863 RepID=UPI002E32BE7E|nr:1-acyl-sn-glycerol-3-phosphate acyltransferase [Streptomyces sp. NBC_01431]